MEQENGQPDGQRKQQFFEFIRPSPAPDHGQCPSG
jgi:hypothetical protein